MDPVAWVVAFPVLLAGGLGALFLRLFLREARRSARATRTSADHRARFERATWAGATIVSAHAAHRVRDPIGSVVVDLRLEVNGTARATYVARARWIAGPGAVHALQPGATVSVRVAADEPDTVYPNVPGVKLWIDDVGPVP